MKFHLALFFVLALVIARRWRTLAGFCGTGIALAGFSLTLGGVGGAWRYLALLRNKDLERLSPSPEFMISIQGLAANARLDNPAVALVGGAIIMLAAALAVRNQPLWRWTAIAILASLAAVPHVYGYDAGIATLPVWLVQFRSRSLASRIAATVFAIPLPFLATLAGPPWSAASSLALLGFLGALLWEARRERSHANA
jgi:hypothetical protein